MCWTLVRSSFLFSLYSLISVSIYSSDLSEYVFIRASSNLYCLTQPLQWHTEIVMRKLQLLCLNLPELKNFTWSEPHSLPKVSVRDQYNVSEIPPLLILWERNVSSGTYAYEESNVSVQESCVWKLWQSSSNQLGGKDSFHWYKLPGIFLTVTVHKLWITVMHRNGQIPLIFYLQVIQAWR